MNKWFFILFLLLISNSFAQENKETKEIEKFKLFRAEENYFYLKDKKQNKYKQDVFDALKFIPLNKKRSIYATIGGEVRVRLEHFDNLLWNEEKDEIFYSQRLSFHTNLVLGRHIRVFGEFYSGYTSHKKKIVEYDELDLHQAFVEFNFPLKKTQNISVRLGRQEMGLGATRLIGVREGPNIRRTFDGARIIYNSGTTTIQSFYTKEVFPKFYMFDNKFSLFDKAATNPKLWGIYSQFKINNESGINELYYLGFESKFSEFSDVSGKETRHTIGLRRFGSLGKRLSFNTEVMYQFGNLADATISAFSIGTDTHYRLIKTKWLPNLGVKLNWSSGDKKTGDNKINSFNALFANPSFYGISTRITPINIFSIHPSIGLNPTKKLTIFMDWGIFWRASKNDGLYAPPQFLIRESNGISDKYIGNQFGVVSYYRINRHLVFDLHISYFVAGSFLELSGPSENIFHISPKISFKF
ncbi:MAG: hypothetical protein COB12_03815 [Flavobacterium sp.]|nr:MAG: hypothetical protein COB12_03815 [Flavobacterium sp.]